MKKERVYPQCILCSSFIDLSDEEVQNYNEENDSF